MLALRFGTATDTGLVRESNEDSVLASGALAVVADGMGGHAGGSLASQLAVARLSSLVERAAALKSDEVLAAIEEANSDILDAANAASECQGMGTTVTGLVLITVGGTDHWMVFNVGDSRVYRLSDEVLTQVTVDHSEVEELVAAGLLSAAEARIDDRRHYVTRVLGMDPPPRADTWMFPPVPGERFMVCSDGLPLEVQDEFIRDVLRSEPDAQQAAERLVAAALSAGGRDNVTVVIVDAGTDLEHAANEDTAPRSQLGSEGRSM